MSDTIEVNGKVFKRIAPLGKDGEKPLRYIKPSTLSSEGITGVVLEGIYLGSVPNSLDEEKDDFKFETESEIVVINHTGALKRELSNVAPGTLVAVNYEGKELMKKGKQAGKSFHNFTVFQLAED